jgi:ribosome-associated heat shock protein Hsp15
MRIDQYLWFIRFFKSRNLASNACKKGQVRINGQIVKPSKEIILFDLIGIRKNQRWHQIEAIALPKNRVGGKLVGLYYIERINSEDIERESIQKFAFHIKRDAGKGRPTKKERRELDDLTEGDPIKI